MLCKALTQGMLLVWTHWLEGDVWIDNRRMQSTVGLVVRSTCSRSVVVGLVAGHRMVLLHAEGQLLLVVGQEQADLWRMQGELQP